MDPSDSTPLMAHLSLNASANTTIVLIHGAFVHGDDWSQVTPHLSDYHLLIPDSPGHGQSKHLTPFSTEYCTRLLNHLIKIKAVGGQAHIVGHSLGAHVAVKLAASHPNAVKSVLISGFSQFPSNKSWLAPYIPRGVWVEQRIESLIPRSMLRWLMDGTEIGRSDPDIVNMSLCRELVDTIMSDEWPSPWPAPSLIIAATKSGIVPSGDSPESAIRLANTGREMNSGTFAVKHEDMRHPWNHQAPLLFAETIRMWIEHREVPKGFIRL